MGKKGEATRRSIRAAAYELFAEHGYTKVTMQDICIKCGLSKGGLYRHYHDKIQLFTEILAELQQIETEREAAMMKQNRSAREILDQYLRHVQQDLSRDMPNLNIALYEFCLENRNTAGAAIVSDQYQRGSEVLLSLIMYGISRGEFRLSDPQGASASILFLIEGLRMTNEVMNIPEQTLQEIFTQIRKLSGITEGGDLK